MLPKFLPSVRLCRSGLNDLIKQNIHLSEDQSYQCSAIETDMCPLNSQGHSDSKSLQQSHHCFIYSSQFTIQHPHNNNHFSPRKNIFYTKIQFGWDNWTDYNALCQIKQSVSTSITCRSLLRFTARVCSIKIFFHKREKSQCAFFQSIPLKCCQCGEILNWGSPRPWTSISLFFSIPLLLLLSNCVGRCIHTTWTYDSCEGVDTSHSYKSLSLYLKRLNI